MSGNGSGWFWFAHRSWSAHHVVLPSAAVGLSERERERVPSVPVGSHSRHGDGERGRLTAVRGIGAWTAGIVQRLCFGDADAVEVGDFHIPNMVAWNLAGEDRADDERMLELLEPLPEDAPREDDKGQMSLI